MKLTIDHDVRAVAEFMQRSIPTARLAGVAAGIHAMAPLLWGQYTAESVNPVDFSADDPQRQPIASGCCLFAVPLCW